MPIRYLSFHSRDQITEKPVPEDMPFGPVQAESFHTLITRMKKAATDDDVAAVVVLLEVNNLGVAQKEEFRAALNLIKESGKPVYAHADWGTTGSLALLCGASRLSMTPTGYLFATGINSEQPYLRGTAR